MGPGQLQLAGGVPRAPRAEPRLMHGWCPERRSRGCQGRGLPQNRRACPPSCPHPSLPVCPLSLTQQRSGEGLSMVAR